MSYSVKELRAASDDEIIRQHDELAKTTVAGVSYYLDELARREQTRQTLAILTYTKALMIFTVIITVATVINLLVFILK